MSEPTRRSVLASLAVALATAGCVTRTRGDGPSGSGPETRPSPSSPTAAPVDQPPFSGITPGTNVPDPDHSVYLANQGSERRTVRVQVERVSTGETVYEMSHDVPPGTELEVYNLERAEPEGVEPFTVCGQVVGLATPAGELSPSGTASEGEQPPDARRTDCATVESSQCYGSVHVTVRADEVDVIYAIC